MTIKNWIFAGIEAILWYAFIYGIFYTIKNDVNLYVASFIILVIAYAASISCPWFRNTDAWKRLFG